MLTDLETGQIISAISSRSVFQDVGMRIVSSSSNLTDLKPLDAPADNLPLELELVIILASLRLDHRLERRPDGDAARHLST